MSLMHPDQFELNVVKAERDKLRTTITEKDARISELESEKQQAIVKWYDEVRENRERIAQLDSALGAKELASIAASAIDKARIAQLERDMSELAPERIALQKQAWVEADRARQLTNSFKRIAQLEEALKVARSGLDGLIKLYNMRCYDEAGYYSEELDAAKAINKINEVIGS